MDLVISLHFPTLTAGSGAVARLETLLNDLTAQGVKVTVDGPSPGDLDRALESIVQDLDAYVAAHPEADVASERARIEEIRGVNGFLRDRMRA